MTMECRGLKRRKELLENMNIFNKRVKTNEEKSIFDLISKSIDGNGCFGKK